MTSYPATIEPREGYYQLTVFHPSGSGVVLAQGEIPKVMGDGISPFAQMMIAVSEGVGRTKVEGCDEAVKKETAHVVLRRAEG